MQDKDAQMVARLLAAGPALLAIAEQLAKTDWTDEALYAEAERLMDSVCGIEKD